MTTEVQRIADQVKSLPKRELEEFLDWLADFSARQEDAWDRELEQGAARRRR